MDEAGKPPRSENRLAADRLGRWERAGLIAFFLVLAGFGCVVEMRSALLRRHVGDVDVFLRAGWAVRSGADLYAVTDDNGLHYRYPPFLAILAAPLADPPPGADPTGMLPFAVSVAIWYVINLLCLAVAVQALASALAVSGALPPAAPGGRRWWAVRFWPVLACIVPIGHTLMRGQSNLLVLALLCVAIAAVLRRRSFRGGLFLAAAIALTIIPVFLLIFPVWRRDRRFLAGCAAGLVVTLGIIPAAVMGPARTWNCYQRLNTVLIQPGLGAGGDASRAEELTNVTATDSQSVLAILHNSLHFDRGSRPPLASPAVRLASYALCGLLTLATLAAAGWRRHRGRRQDPLTTTLLWGELILIMSLTSPVCPLHYFALGVPLVMGLLVARWQRQQTLYPGTPLVILFVLGAVAHLLPHIPAFTRLRDGGLALYGALALWAAGFVALRSLSPGRPQSSFWHRLVRGERCLRQQPHWESYAGAGWADRIMQEVVTDRFHAKQGRTIARWSLQARGQELVVYLKRHYRLSWWHGLLALLRPGGCWSPAMQEWNNLQWAQRHGLPVPRAAAGGEFIGPWGRLQSFLAVEELTGMLPLHEAVPLAQERLDPVAFVRWKRGLAVEMVAITCALHRRQRFHKDLYLCHFYIAADDTARPPADWGGKVRLIDLHRLGHHRWTSLWWRAKDIAQLLYSSDVPGVTVRDRLRFWRGYLAADPLGWAERWLNLAVRFKSWNNQRRRLRRSA
jgi:heptose I phosphotransferase